MRMMFRDETLYFVKNQGMASLNIWKNFEEAIDWYAYLLNQFFHLGQAEKNFLYFVSELFYKIHNNIPASIHDLERLRNIQPLENAVDMFGKGQGVDLDWKEYGF